MYGSNFWIVTLKPLDWSNLANEADIIPFPKEELTPPVTKINFDFVSPEESIVSSEVDMVQIPAVEGDAGILPNHAPYMTILRQGIVEVTFDKDNIKKYQLLNL